MDFKSVPSKRLKIDSPSRSATDCKKMDWTDVHYRQLARLISKDTFLYTEMVVDQTLAYTQNVDKHLWFPKEQHPIVCQLGGSNPKTLAEAAVIVEKYGYDEINLNCGCPSDKVAGAGCFGAKLMVSPELVAQCCKAMMEAVKIPVTIKCRIGVDTQDSYEDLCNFINVVWSKGGVNHFIIHARKCFLNGLNPAQNRTVPPLRRGWVLALARDFPQVSFSLNGQIQSCHEASSILAKYEGKIHGIMIGRAAYHTPWHCLANADSLLFNSCASKPKSRRQVLMEYSAYADSMIGKWGTKKDGSPYPNVRAVVKPILGLLHGEKGTKKFKQTLDFLLKTSKNNTQIMASDIIKNAMDSVPDDVWDATVFSPECSTADIVFGEIPDPPLT